MNITGLLQQIFIPLDGGTITIIEKYSSFDLNYNIQKPFCPDNLNKKLYDAFQILPDNDSWALTFLIQNDQPIHMQSSANNYSEFEQLVSQKIRDIEGEEINVRFHVTKNTQQGIVNIYDYKVFCDFVKGLNTINFLNIIKEDLRNNDISFVIIGEQIDCFHTNNIKVGSCESIQNNISPAISQLKVTENCYFANFLSYPFYPTHFNIVKKPISNNSISEKLNKLTSIFCIASIYDITSIDGNNFNYKLNGYRTIKGSFDIDEDIISSTDIYMKIYEWIYLDSGNVTDKIGLSRNILSIYLKNDGSIELTEDTYFSIQSGFRTYLQQNLSKYIEVRSKISEQLISITQKSNDVMEKYLGDFQKNVITFVSYFISVFLIKFISSNNAGKILNADTRNISLSFLLISFMYLLFSRWNLSQEKIRLETRYSNLKKRFLDLLVEEDIKKILQNDKEFNSEMSFFEDRKKMYTYLWIGTLLILLVVVIMTSA